MSLNNFEYYTKLAEHETSTYKECNNTLELIQKIESCRTICEIKSLLHEECNITTECLKKSIGTSAQVTVIDKPEAFLVQVEYSNEVCTCVFPKLTIGDDNHEN